LEVNKGQIEVPISFYGMRRENGSKVSLAYMFLFSLKFYIIYEEDFICMLVEDKRDAFKMSLVIPVCNPDELIFKKLIDSLLRQTLRIEILLIDSSPDNMVLEAPSVMRIIKISSREFHHGATRNMGVEKTDGDIIIFMTQDVLPFDNYSIEKLIKPFFEDERVGATYGRQLPRPEAGAIEAHSRLYNYPSASHIKAYEDSSRLGIKACFMSNSFSAYRRTAFLDVGGISFECHYG
jgi:rhamnosyltransferase